jgi:hypothetical protein
LPHQFHRTYRSYGTDGANRYGEVWDTKRKSAAPDDE